MITPSIISTTPSKVSDYNDSKTDVSVKLVDAFSNPFGNDVYKNLMVSSVFNQSETHIRQLLKAALPSKDLGMTILLTSITSSKFFEKLRADELNLALSLTNIASTFIRVNTDSFQASPSTTINALGLTNLALGLSGIDDSNAVLVKKFVPFVMEQLWITIKQPLSDELNKYFNRSDLPSNMKRGMYAIDYINDRILFYVNTKLAGMNLSSEYSKFKKVMDLDEKTIDAFDRLFFAMTDAGVLGFTNNGNEYGDIFKLYLSRITASLALSTASKGSVWSDYKDSLDKDGFFSPSSLESFVSNGYKLSSSSDSKDGSFSLTQVWSLLQQEVSKYIARNTSLSLISARETIRNINIFKHEFIKFIDNQESFLKESYKNGDSLFQAYKNFLLQLKNTTDPVAAGELISLFTSSSLFANSMAGLIKGMCDNRDFVDSSLVNDVAQVIIDEEVIKAFNRGPFQKVAKLGLRSPIISDYGSGLRGTNYEIMYESDRCFEFQAGNKLSYASEDSNTGLMATSTPWTSESCLEQYCIMGSRAISDPEMRRMIAGSMETTTIRKEFPINTTVSQSHEIALRLINNAVSVQFYVHYEASRSWFRQYLLALWDYSAYFKNIFESEESFLRHHPYRAVIETNLQSMREEISLTLGDMFECYPDVIPSNCLPVIRLKQKDATVSTNPQLIMTSFLEVLKTKGLFLHLLEDIRMVKRYMSRIGKHGTSFIRSNKIGDMNSSVLANVGKNFSFIDFEAETLSVNMSREMVANSSSIEEAKSAMFRDFSHASWLYMFEVNDTLSLMNASTRGSRINKSAADRSKFGTHAEEHSFAPNFVYDVIETMAVERLVKYYQLDTFASLKYARVSRSLSSVTQCIIKLASSLREGMSVGLSPVEVAVTTDSDRNTFASILANIGLTEDIKIKLTDTDFFNAVKEGGSLGFPFVITASARKLLDSLTAQDISDMTSDKSKMKFITIKDALSLSNNFKMNGASLKTINFYLRDAKILNFMLNDIIVESFADDYQLIQIKDDFVSELLGKESQTKFLAVQVKEKLEIEDISNSARIPAILKQVAGVVAEFFFPLAGLDGKSTRPSQDEEQKDDVEEEESEN